MSRRTACRVLLSGQLDHVYSHGSVEVVPKGSLCQGRNCSSEDRVRTWADERRRLARDILRVLRSEQGGRFTLDESANTLMDITSTGVMGLSEAFNAFVQGQVADQYQSVLEGLSKDSDAELADLVGRVRRRLGGDHVLFDRVFELVEFHEELREHISRLSTNDEEVHSQRLVTHWPSFQEKVTSWTT